MEEYAIEVSGVTKRFGEVVANDHVDLTLKKGEILAVLGENGSGKTTLMNMLSGIYFPDEGTIKINGKEVVINSPRDAFELGIGMVHQHFKLINVFTAAENIILGLKGKDILRKKDMENEVAGKIREISEAYGFEIDPYQKVYSMSVSQKQTVEIVKVLYRGADIFILDEPTAVLTPQETKKLFAVLKNMQKAGKSIIIITHKLNEVMEISDRVAILRKGRSLREVRTTGVVKEFLTEMMFEGKTFLDIKRTEPKNLGMRISMKGVTVRAADGVVRLKDASFEAHAGEILGVAGVSGSGQKELVEVIAGLQRAETGEIMYYPPEGGSRMLSRMNPDEISRSGVKLAFVPEDRLGMGLVGSMDLTDNMMLRSYKDSKGFLADRRPPRELAKDVVSRLEVSTPGVSTPVSRLSGGNVQKVLLGREIASKPTVLMVAYPVRGLDINSSYTIYNLLSVQKENGSAVICVGEDLDVLIELCDRILVLSGGSITGIVDARNTTKEEIGMLMLGGDKKQ